MHLMLVTAILLGAAVAGEPVAALDALRDLSLPDQLGVEHSLDEYGGEPLVVIVVTAKRLRNVRAWERDLRDRFPDLRTVRIADLPEDSPATVDDVATKLQERVPEGVSVLIDLDRRWATALELDTSRPNLLLIGSDGELLAIHHGRHNRELSDEVLADIDHMLGGS